MTKLPDCSVPVVSTWVTVVLAVVLMVPFAVRTLTSAEPMPAVLLPAGAAKIFVANGVATFHETSIIGRGRDGRLVTLDARRLIAPLPVHFIYGLESDRFGQDEAATRAVTLKRSSWSIQLPRHRPSVQAQADARAWLLAALVREGLQVESIVIRTDTVQIDMASEREVSRVTISETIVDLR